MKIVDSNSSEKKGPNKSLIVGGCVGLLCVVAIVVCVAMFAGKNNGSVETENTQANDTVSGNTSLLSEVNVVDSTSTHDSEPVDESLEQVISYTSLECDEDSLKQLVIDTIRSANIQIEDARLDENFDTVSVIMDAVDRARINGELGGTFAPLGDESNPLPDDKQHWTYLEVSGAIGGLLFNGKDPVRNILEQSDLLKNLVAEGVYLFDTERLEMDAVSGKFEAFFVDVITGNYDVNFEVNINYDGQDWIALIGNVNHEYRVLDVVKAEDLDNVLVYNQVEMPVNAIVGQEVVEEPEDVFVQEEVTEPVNTQDIILDDPYVGMPNYTGPREGYFYSVYIHDYKPISEDSLLIGENLMGDMPASREEYEAAGGTYAENCY